jgi:hypothetical protein
MTSIEASIEASIERSGEGGVGLFLGRVRVDWRKDWTRGSGGREERAYSKVGRERRRSWEMRARKAG